jgi:hypothetical protein
MGMDNMPSFSPEPASISMPSDSSLASMVSDLPPATQSSGLSVDMPSDKELASMLPNSEPKKGWFSKVGDKVKQGIEWEKQHLPEQEAWAKRQVDAVKHKYDDYKNMRLNTKTSPQPAQKVMNKQDYVPQKHATDDYLQTMDDDELIDYARREPQSVFFRYNKYEDELVRREKNRLKFEKDFAKESSRMAENLSSKFNMLGFINPIETTLSAKKGSSKGKMCFTIRQGAEKILIRSLADPTKAFVTEVGTIFDPQLKKNPYKKLYNNLKHHKKIKVCL